MAIFSSYFHTGIGVQDYNGTQFYIAGRDFNPTAPTLVFDESITAIPTAPTDLTNYRHGHEIVVLVAIWKNNDTVSRTDELKIGFDFPGGNHWVYSWGTQTLAANGGWYVGYAYAGIDYDEFNQNGTATFTQRAGSSSLSTITKTYTGYNTSWDTTRTPGMLWVEGNNIHYTDGSNGSLGYEHLIDYDSTYSSYVGTSYSGRIRLSNDGNNRRIYYIDENGYKRRTYLADDWYGGASYVGTDRAGYIWTSSGDTNNGYGYLCFVGYNGYRYRIMNGPI